jgi:hypothetical protein
VSSGVEVEVLRRVGGLMERGLRELADSAELDDGAVKIEGPPDVSHAQRCVVKLLNRQGWPLSLPRTGQVDSGCRR